MLGLRQPPSSASQTSKVWSLPYARLPTESEDPRSEEDWIRHFRVDGTDSRRWKQLLVLAVMIGVFVGWCGASLAVWGRLVPRDVAGLYHSAVTPSPPSANPSWTSWPPAVQSLLEAKTRQDLLNPSTPKLRFAFMSVYAKDVHASPETEARYFLAQRVLLYRLLRDGRTRVRRKEIEVVVLYTSGVDPEHLKQFEMLGAVLKEVALIRGESPEPRWTTAWTKFSIFDQSEYEKIAYLDTDVLPITNIDYLFNIRALEPADSQELVEENGDTLLHPHFLLAASDPFFGRAHQWNSSMFNSGVLVVKPSRFHFEGLLSLMKHPDKFNWAYGDQGLLNTYFRHGGPYPFRRIGLEHNTKHPIDRDLKFANALHFTGRPWANIFDDELVLEFWRTATEVLLEEQPLARALGLGTSWSSLQDSIGERDLPVLRGQGKVLEYARLVKCRRAERNGSKYSECPDPRIFEALGAERLDLEELEDGLRRTTAEAARLTAEWQGGQNKVVK